MTLCKWLVAVCFGLALINASAAPASKAKEQSGLTGSISFYSEYFRGKRTANGERFDPDAMTLAHRSLPFGTQVKVTNLRNGRSVLLRVNDRGPFVRARIADVSKAAARALGFLRKGVTRAKLEVIDVPRKTP